MDPTIATTDRGIWAIKWSFVILAATAALQLVVVYFSGSVALLADTIHNIADAGTAIPLWIAFVLARRKPTPTFTYGYGRVEDFAGLAIVLIILFSALVAGYEAIDRLFHPRTVLHLGWLAAAGLIGFIGQRGSGGIPHQGRQADQQRGAHRRWLPCPNRRSNKFGCRPRRVRSVDRVSARRPDHRSASLLSRSLELFGSPQRRW